MALTGPRPQTARMGDSVVPPLLSLKMSAQKIWAGAMVMLDAGYAKKGAAAVGKVVIGMAEETVDNSAGSPGDKSILVRRGPFRWDNSAAADEITQAEVGTLCYMVDDCTVAKTSNSGARSVAGVVLAVEDAGVFVQQGLLSQAEMDAIGAAAVANVPALTGSLTGTANGSLVDIAAAAGACAGAGSPSAANVDSAIATAVAPIVSGVNEQNKEIMTKLNALIAAGVSAGWMAAP